MTSFYKDRYVNRKVFKFPFWVLRKPAIRLTNEAVLRQQLFSDTLYIKSGDSISWAWGHLTNRWEAALFQTGIGQTNLNEADVDQASWQFILSQIGPVPL